MPTHTNKETTMAFWRQVFSTLKGELRCPNCARIAQHRSFPQIDRDVEETNKFFGDPLPPGYQGFECIFCGELFQQMTAHEFADCASNYGEKQAIEDYLLTYSEIRANLRRRYGRKK